MEEEISGKQLESEKVQAVLQIIVAKKNGILSSLQSLEVRERILASQRAKIESIVNETASEKGNEFWGMSQTYASKIEAYKMILRKLDDEKNAILLEKEQLLQQFSQLDIEEQRIRSLL